MAQESSTEDHAAGLGARIAAARARFAVRRDGPTVGAVLGALNDELDEIVYEDHDDAQRRLHKIEARLVAEELKLEDEEEERDG